MAHNNFAFTHRNTSWEALAMHLLEGGLSDVNSRPERVFYAQEAYSSPSSSEHTLCRGGFQIKQAHWLGGYDIYLLSMSLEVRHCPL